MCILFCSWEQKIRNFDHANAPVVYLHGLGSSAKEFANVFHAVGLALGANHVFLDGPQHDALTGKRRWFPFSMQRSVLARLVEEAADALLRTLQELDLVSAYGKHGGITLVGHSQGAMLAIAAALRMSIPIERVVSYAGYCATEIPKPPCEVKFVLYSSRADEFLQNEWVAESVASLSAVVRTPVTHYLSHQLGHRFSRAWLDHSNFVSQPTSAAILRRASQ